MAITKHLIMLSVILIGLLATKETMGTSCNVEHPQTAVCRASFGKLTVLFLILFSSSIENNILMRNTKKVILNFGKMTKYLDKEEHRS